MDLLLFFAIAAVCAIVGDMYLCWQTKKYEAQEEAEREALAASAPPEASEADTAVQAAAQTAPEDGGTLAAEAQTAVEAAPESVQTDEAAASSEPEGERKADKKSREGKKVVVRNFGRNWSLKTMRIIAAVLAFPVAALLAYYSYHVAHGANSGELVWVLKLLIIFELLIPIGLMDAKFMKIPNKVLLVGLVFFVGFFLVDLLVLKQEFVPLLKATVLGLLLGGGIFLLTGLISRSGMGGGDIKLFALLGLMMTWYGVFNVIFFSILLVVIYSLFLLATKKIKKETRLPMGPFTTLAMILVILLGI